MPARFVAFAHLSRDVLQEQQRNIALAASSMKCVPLAPLAEQDAIVARMPIDSRGYGPKLADQRLPVERLEKLFELEPSTMRAMMSRTSNSMRGLEETMPYISSAG